MSPFIIHLLVPTVSVHVVKLLLSNCNSGRSIRVDRCGCMYHVHTSVYIVASFTNDACSESDVCRRMMGRRDDSVSIWRSARKMENEFLTSHVLA